MKKAIIQDGIILGIGDHYDTAIADARSSGFDDIDESEIADRSDLTSSQNQPFWATVTERVATAVRWGEPEPRVTFVEDYALQENGYFDIEIDDTAKVREYDDATWIFVNGALAEEAFFKSEGETDEDMVELNLEPVAGLTDANGNQVYVRR